MLENFRADVLNTNLPSKAHFLKTDTTNLPDIQAVMGLFRPPKFNLKIDGADHITFYTSRYHEQHIFCRF